MSERTYGPWSDSEHQRGECFSGTTTITMDQRERACGKCMTFADHHLRMTGVTVPDADAAPKHSPDTTKD